jgi:DNA polymerase I
MYCRHLPDINGQAGGGATYGAVAAAERQAINTVIQGSASELIKTAMALIQSHINEYPYWSGSDDSTAQPTARLVPTLLMQIHDELVYEVPLPSLSGDEAADALADQAAVCAFVSLLRESMERKVGALFELKVPLTVNIQTSTHSWGLFQKLKL